MILSNVAYTPKCNSNLISLGQLREAGISYHDYPKCMILKQGVSTIGSAQRHKNLFILDMKLDADRVLMIKGRGRPTYLLSKDPQVRL